MKFICGNCGELIKEANTSKVYDSWMPHEQCGHETFYKTFLPSREKPDPTPERTRPMPRDNSGLVLRQSVKQEGAKDGDKENIDAKLEEMALAIIKSKGYAEDAAKGILARVGVRQILSDCDLSRIHQGLSAAEVVAARNSDDEADTSLQSFVTQSMAMSNLESEWADPEEIAKEKEKADKEKLDKASPSAADLDAVDEERKAAEATAVKSQSQTQAPPNQGKKGKGAK